LKVGTLFIYLFLLEKGNSFNQKDHSTVNREAASQYTATKQTRKLKITQI
jgi:hypothetical protein